MNILLFLFSGVCTSKILRENIVENRCNAPMPLHNLIQRRGRVLNIRGYPHFSVRITFPSSDTKRVNIFSGKPIEQIFIQARTSSATSSPLVGSWSENNLPPGHSIVLCGNIEASTVARTAEVRPFRSASLDWLGECSANIHFHVYAMVLETSNFGQWHKITLPCVQYQSLKDSGIVTTRASRLNEPKEQTLDSVKCVDRYKACQTKWKKRRFCNNNFSIWAKKYCPVSCEMCTPISKEDACEDQKKYTLSCIRWAEKNRCHSGGYWSSLVQERCPRSCNMCTNENKAMLSQK